jgi:hypothetical protein
MEIFVTRLHCFGWLGIFGEAARNKTFRISRVSFGNYVKAK